MDASKNTPGSFILRRAEKICISLASRKHRRSFKGIPGSIHSFPFLLSKGINRKSSSLDPIPTGFRRKRRYPTHHCSCFEQISQKRTSYNLCRNSWSLSPSLWVGFLRRPQCNKIDDKSIQCWRNSSCFSVHSRCFRFGIIQIPRRSSAKWFTQGTTCITSWLHCHFAWYFHWILSQWLSHRHLVSSEASFTCVCSLWCFQRW